MNLYYGDIFMGYILTNHNMSIEDALAVLGIDMDDYAAEHGWDDWEYEPLRLEVA